MPKSKYEDSIGNFKINVIDCRKCKTSWFICEYRNRITVGLVGYLLIEVVVGAKVISFPSSELNLAINEVRCDMRYGFHSHTGNFNNYWTPVGDWLVVKTDSFDSRWHIQYDFARTLFNYLTGTLTSFIWHLAISGKNLGHPLEGFQCSDICRAEFQMLPF